MVQVGERLDFRPSFFLFLVSPLPVRHLCELGAASGQVLVVGAPEPDVHELLPGHLDQSTHAPKGLGGGGGGYC